jgi:hypothetical protein
VGVNSAIDVLKITKSISIHSLKFETYLWGLYKKIVQNDQQNSFPFEKNVRFQFKYTLMAFTHLHECIKSGYNKK